MSNAISVKAQSGLCSGGVPFYYADLSGNPDSVYISPQDVRSGSCCGSVFPDRCIEFEILLDSGAIGIKFDIYSGAVPPGALYYQINCGTLVPVGDIICLSGTGPHTLTFCKPGNNPNRYAITSIPGVVQLPDKYITEGCSTEMGVTGLVDSTVAWNDITSGTGYYNSFLNCTTGCVTTAIATQPGFPSFIDFEVCGMIYSTQCPAIINHVCDTLRLFISPIIQVSITYDPPVCGSDTSRLLMPLVSGQNGAVSYQWFDAPGGGGTLIGNDSFYLAAAPGDYSIIVYDTSYPACSRDTADISVNFYLMPAAFTRSVGICYGDSLFAGGMYQLQAGTYYDTLTAYNSCDSILTTHLAVANCDDGNPCIIDDCNAGNCFHAPLNCDDANPCTTDQCINGVCRHPSAVVSPDSLAINWWKRNCCCK